MPSTTTTARKTGRARRGPLGTPRSVAAVLVWRPSIDSELGLCYELVYSKADLGGAWERLKAALAPPAAATLRAVMAGDDLSGTFSGEGA